VRCIPAIDLRGGKCVRLYQGDFAKETIYGDPVELALSYCATGATALHIVDLDAARTGFATNRELIKTIIAKCPVDVEVGGGIRTSLDAESLLRQGAARVVIGTAGIENPGLANKLAYAHPGQIAIGLDHKRITDKGQIRREVALRGWVQGSGIEFADALAMFSEAPFGAVIVTDIDRDGTLRGPDLVGLRFALEHCENPVIASGGIAKPSDLEALSEVEAKGKKLLGAIVGKALLSGAMTLKEALAACAR
jgi:phosphoribosylformimino-5-aminoimidazole carboxamide ribotide isomerase